MPWESWRPRARNPSRAYMLVYREHWRVTAKMRYIDARACVLLLAEKDKINGGGGDVKE